MAYQPVSCAFYDELEAFATLREPVLIRYYDEGQTLHALETTGVIVDLFIRDKAEYLRTDTGREVRLDRLESVGGKVLQGYC